MNTQNVNVKTAAHESSRKIGGEDLPVMSSVSIEALTPGKGTCNAMAFIIPSRQEIYTWARWNGVEWVSTFGDAGLEEMRHYCAEIQLVSEAEAMAMENARYRKPWEEISEERYIDQLEVLPPVDWHWGVCESFKSAEMYGGDVTCIFAKYKGRFFECRDLISLKPKEIMDSIITAFFAGDSVNSRH